MEHRGQPDACVAHTNPDIAINPTWPVLSTITNIIVPVRSQSAFGWTLLSPPMFGAAGRNLPSDEFPIRILASIAVKSNCRVRAGVNLAITEISYSFCDGYAGPNSI